MKKTKIKVSREFLINSLAHYSYGMNVLEEQFGGDYDHEDDAYDEAYNQLSEFTNEELVENLLDNYNPYEFGSFFNNYGISDESGIDGYGEMANIEIELDLP